MSFELDRKDLYGQICHFFLKEIKEKNDDAQLLKIAMTGGKQTNKQTKLNSSFTRCLFINIANSSTVKVTFALQLQGTEGHIN